MNAIDKFALLIESKNVNLTINLPLKIFNDMLISYAHFDLKDEFKDYMKQIQFNVILKDVLLELLTENILPFDEELKESSLKKIKLNKTNYFIFYVVNCLDEIEFQPFYLTKLQESINEMFKRLVYYFKKLQSIEVQNEIKH